MSVYRRINDSKNDKFAFERIIAYVTKKPYTVWETDVGAVGCRKEAVLQDMTATKHSFHKDSGRQYEHAVLSLTPNFPTMKDADYMEIGKRIASHCIGHQCVFALHKDTRIRHLHFIWNTISYKDGKRFNMGPPGLNQEKLYINKILEEYDLDPVRSSPNEMVDNSYHDIKFPGQFLEIYDDTPDDREMFLAPPPKTEEEINDDDLSWAEARSIWYGNYGGNATMYNNYYPAKKPQTTVTATAQRTVPATVQTTTPATIQRTAPATMQKPVPTVTQTASITAGNTTSGNGLNLVSINNIQLGSMNDLSQATSDLNDAFNSAARAGATALATMRRNGIDDGVTVTTINNFTVGGSEDTNCNPFGIIDIPYMG